MCVARLSCVFVGKLLQQQPKPQQVLPHGAAAAQPLRGPHSPTWELQLQARSSSSRTVGCCRCLRCSRSGSRGGRLGGSSSTHQSCSSSSTKGRSRGSENCSSKCCCSDAEEELFFFASAAAAARLCLMPGKVACVAGVQLQRVRSKKQQQQQQQQQQPLRLVAGPTAFIAQWHVGELKAALEASQQQQGPSTLCAEGAVQQEEEVQQQQEPVQQQTSKESLLLGAATVGEEQQNPLLLLLLQLVGALGPSALCDGRLPWLLPLLPIRGEAAAPAAAAVLLAASSSSSSTEPPQTLRNCLGGPDASGTSLLLFLGCQQQKGAPFESLMAKPVCFQGPVTSCRGSCSFGLLGGLLQWQAFPWCLSSSAESRGVVGGCGALLLLLQQHLGWRDLGASGRDILCRAARWAAAAAAAGSEKSCVGWGAPAAAGGAPQGDRDTLHAAWGAPRALPVALISSSSSSVLLLGPPALRGPGAGPL
ncbi:hypothetical protein, conserved, partial [Eimeria tenella]